MGDSTRIFSHMGYNLPLPCLVDYVSKISIFERSRDIEKYKITYWLCFGSFSHYVSTSIELEGNMITINSDVGYLWKLLRP
jgi:hypothetical protein